MVGAVDDGGRCAAKVAACWAAWAAAATATIAIKLAGAGVDTDGAVTNLGCSFPPIKTRKKQTKKSPRYEQV